MRDITNEELDFCHRYQLAVSQIIDEYDEFVPVFSTDDDYASKRAIFDLDEVSIQTIRNQDITTNGTHSRAVIYLPRNLLTGNLTDEDVLRLAIMDIATWASENSPQLDSFGNVGMCLLREAIACRITQAAEFSNLLSKDESEKTYNGIAFISFENLAKKFYPENAHALIVGECPGIVTVIDDVVKITRQLPAASLPININAEATTANGIIAILAGLHRSFLLNFVEFFNATTDFL